MSSDQSELVLELAVEVLDSFEKLELLVQIAGATSPLTADALPHDRDELDELVAKRVVSSGPSGYSVAADGPWSRHVAALVALYRVERMEVVNLMAKASLHRLRGQAARAFADAFVIRPKKKGDDGDR